MTEKPGVPGGISPGINTTTSKGAEMTEMTETMGQRTEELEKVEEKSAAETGAALAGA